MFNPIASMAAKVQGVSAHTKQIAHTGVLAVQKNAPAICTYGGLVLMTTGAGLAVKTASSDESREIGKRVNASIEACRVNMSNGEDAQTCYYEVGKTTFKAAGEYIRLYAPAVACFAVGAGLVVAGHKINTKRVAGLATALTATTGTLMAYRERVADAIGAEKEQMIFDNGNTFEVKDEDGKTQKLLSKDESGLTSLSRLFDETAPDWSKSITRNLFFLNGAQKSIQNKVNLYGVYTLNEAFRNELGLKPTNAGAVMCWKAGDKVDLGISAIFDEVINNTDPVNNPNDNYAGSYNIWITPNCSHTIYDTNIKDLALQGGDGEPHKES